MPKSDDCATELHEFCSPCDCKCHTNELEYALTESLKLQAHYAELLNMHDGGQRLIFKTKKEWFDRILKNKVGGPNA